MELDPKISDKIKKLQEKYDADGQDLNAHLEGLLHSDYLKYWEYIHLDTLLSLQKPKTGFPDEMIFITYHQITELYFKMVMHEMKQLLEKDNINEEFFLKRIKRMDWYFGQLISSFDLISVGLDQDQFLKFRAALHPASGFQSVQYRMVEIASTDFINLVGKDNRNDFTDYSTIEEMYESLYWKKGAIDIVTGKKTLTLKLFEDQYTDLLLKMANQYKSKNLYAAFKKLSFEAQKNPEVVMAMKRFDSYVNINWPLAHYKYAVSYLHKSKTTVDSTGGTNWQKYLPPKFQKQIFFPSLYTQQEINDWGKSWVETEVFNQR
jgi:tryptophan 2,3-dioxygenase